MCIGPFYRALEAQEWKKMQEKKRIKRTLDWTALWSLVIDNEKIMNTWTLPIRQWYDKKREKKRYTAHVKWIKLVRFEYRSTVSFFPLNNKMYETFGEVETKTITTITKMIHFLSYGWLLYTIACNSQFVFVSAALCSVASVCYQENLWHRHKCVSLCVYISQSVLNITVFIKLCTRRSKRLKLTWIE